MTEMKKAIYFDMDGTIADLFGVDDWDNKIHNGDSSPYAIAAPRFDIEKMAYAIAQLKNKGYTIGIISYNSYNATKEFATEVRKVKRAWLKQYFPYAEEIHIVDHKMPKWKVAKIHNAILVDDCRANRQEWKWGATINAYKTDIVEKLLKI